MNLVLVRLAEVISNCLDILTNNGFDSQCVLRLYLPILGVQTSQNC